MPDGTIVGTFKQHGTGLPLVLAPSAGVPRILPDTTSNVTDGRYRNEKMVELLAWISTEHSIAHFYAMMPADQVDVVQPAFDQMVLSAQVP